MELIQIQEVWGQTWYSCSQWIHSGNEEMIARFVYHLNYRKIANLGTINELLRINRNNTYHILGGGLVCGEQTSFCCRILYLRARFPLWFIVTQVTFISLWQNELMKWTKCREFLQTARLLSISYRKIITTALSITLWMVEDTWTSTGGRIFTLLVKFTSACRWNVLSLFFMKLAIACGARIWNMMFTMTIIVCSLINGTIYEPENFRSSAILLKKDNQ